MVKVEGLCGWIDSQPLFNSHFSLVRVAINNRVRTLFLFNSIDWPEKKKMHQITVQLARPKLKFYLFPLIRPPLKKGPSKNKITSIFSQEYFFWKFHCNPRELSNVKVLS